MQRLYDTLEKDIRPFALSLAQHEQEANDLIQYAWEKAIQTDELESWPYYRQKAWFYRVMKNQLIDIRRKQKKETTLDEQNEPIFHQSELSSFELMDALQRLPPMQRELLFKRYWVGLTSREIGEQLDIPAATIRYQLAKAIHTLRHSL